ncbi:MAG: hypothetical protein IKZ84_01605, partial [Victivallales bacterium]|nr:hypothetical protein [Victivallales bacterium]
MPELPEVETVRNVIEPQVIGREILSIDVRNAKVIAHPTTKDFLNILQGRIINGMAR